MSVVDEPEALGPWIEAAQTTVQRWVEAHEPDVSAVEAGLDDAGAEDLSAWIGEGPTFETPAPDVADLETRLEARAQASDAQAAVWPVMDDAVADAVGDAQAVVERRVESRFARPSTKGSVEASERAGSRWPWVAAVAVLAASVVAVFWVQGGRLEQAREAERLEQAAQIVAEGEDTEGVASAAELRERGSASRRSLAVTPSDGVPTENIESAPEPGPGGDATLEARVPDASSEAPAPSEARRVRRSPVREQRRSLQALAEEAERLWRAGDRKGAQAALMEVVRRGGRTSRVELAYADLFSLARQRGEVASRKRLYRGYLRRFPKGRLADDARAGLCRVSAAKSRGACWQDYLEHHPAGSYRAEAKAAR